MTETATSGPEPAAQEKKKRPKWVWSIPVLLFLAGSSFIYWHLFVHDRVATDNSYVIADSAAVSSRVAGTVSRVLVSNDDLVREGDVLVELDPEDFKTEADRHRAALSRIDAEIIGGEVGVRFTDNDTAAQIRAAEADVQVAGERQVELQHRLSEVEKNRTAIQAELARAKRDLERYTNLWKEGAGSDQQRDKADTAFKKTEAQFEAADAQVAGARAALAAALKEIDRSKAQSESARANRLRVDMDTNKIAALRAKRAETLAELKAAELNLSYCVIKAPISGYVAQKRVQTGERLHPGQPLLAVVPLNSVYIEANFKETQLKDVRLGQAAEIRADIYPGHTYTGRVAGIRAGTGAAFSLLPPENATGNWIKVVQRIPVRIILDKPPPAKHPLRIGASLKVIVFTADKSGPVLHAE